MSRLPYARELRRKKDLRDGKRTPMKKRNRARAKKRRQLHFGDKAEFVRSHSCCVCGKAGPSDPHHIPSRAAGGTSKDLVPLCHFHHTQFHTMGQTTFQAAYDIDLRALTKRYEAWFTNDPQDLAF